MLISYGTTGYGSILRKHISFPVDETEMVTSYPYYLMSSVVAVIDILRHPRLY